MELARRSTRNIGRASARPFHGPGDRGTLGHRDEPQAVGPRSNSQPRTTSVVFRSRGLRSNSYIDERQRRTMRKIVLVVFASLVIAAGAADSVAQTAGVSVSTVELRDVAAGWSAKKQILGKGVYNDTGDKVGEINDLIVTPTKAVSYAIVG